MAGGAIKEGRKRRMKIRNVEGRSMFRLAKVESELEVRRTKWWKDVVDRPEENRQLRAAVAGKMEEDMEG